MKQHLTDLIKTYNEAKPTDRWKKYSIWNKEQLEELAELLVKLKRGFELDQKQIDRLKILLKGINWLRANKTSHEYALMALKYIQENDEEER